jgi:DNA mismatch endonuclease, patch repair protein
MAPRPNIPKPSSTEARNRMRANRNRDTKPETQLRSLLHRRGLRFRVDVSPIPGVRRRADLVFPRARVAVFVDGCFWHGCPQHATWPKANADFWREKIETNRRRDEDTNRKFAEAGWVVVRVWEHEAVDGASLRIEQLVLERCPRPNPTSSASDDDDALER